ncbi:MAG: hypothetical protein ATN36_00885 [Epulopiscium sp. Nele67-Bin005]|nr:MAG: hypothetical protein ATN36_00885 [Epulopiscium sp. Nele67-Bin005]
METIKRTHFKAEFKAPLPKVSVITMYRVLLIWPTILLIAGLMSTPFYEILEGMHKIRLANDILLTDYFEIGGVGATFINAAILAYANIFLIFRLKMKPNGIIVASIFLISGFAFMGKNVMNIWPFYLGGLAYAKYHKIEYKSVVVINMLSTALSPISSVLVAELAEHHFLISFILTGLIGGFIGFIMPPISASIMTAHSGYNLYNMGLSAGLVGIVIYSIIDALGYEGSTNNIIYQGETIELMKLLLIYCIILIVIGYRLNDKSFKGYDEILKHSGRIVTDYIQLTGFGLTIVNMGLSGILCIIYVLLMKGDFNGPIMCAILTVMGFSAFGKHFKNILPIIIGVTLTSLIITREVDLTILIISALFGTSLAPIAGEFGFSKGILAGMLHFTLVLNVGSFHGGLMLYNNGLAAGIIAMLFIPMMDAFRRGDNKRK